ncbi:MAG: hypothetical protein ABL859_06850, partial [Methylotenera sp.]
MGIESESNDTIATADAAVLGTAMTGQLSSSADKDIYSYSVGTSGILSINFTAPTSNFSGYTLTAYDSAGTELGSWFSYGGAYQVNAPITGNYFVEVTGAYNTAQYSVNTTLTFLSAE